MAEMNKVTKNTPIKQGEKVSIRIENWDKYNPRKDIKNPSWFAFSNRMLENPDIYNLTHGEFRAWVYCLTKASQSNNDTIQIDIRHANRICNITVNDFNGMIRKMLESGSLYVDVRNPYVSVRECTQSVHDRQTDITNKQTNNIVNSRIDHAEVCLDSGIHEHPLEIAPMTFEEKASMIAEYWNDVAELNNLPKVKKPLTKDRLAAMKPAMAEFPSFSDWHRIIAGVTDNSFNLGDNDRKWKANFDWLFYKTKFNYRKLWESSSVKTN